MTDARFMPCGPLRGELRPPADKSISHRAAILGAMATGRSQVRGYLDAADTRSTLAAARALGAEVNERAGEAGLDVEIVGAGLHGAADAVIDVGNAGTLLRILPGWLAGHPGGAWTLDGDESIGRRPVDRVAEPLRLMGAEVECAHGFLPPLRIRGAQLRAIDYELPVASAQVKSCLLLAGLLADGETVIAEPEPSRDHSERMLAAAGAPIELSERGIAIRATDRLEPLDHEIPGDFSSAAFALVAAALVPGSELVLRGVGVNPTRIGLIRVLERMGASIEPVAADEGAGEPVGDILVRHSSLTATEVVNTEVPSMIDELPLIGLAGAFAEGETLVSGAAELRHKESDRLAAVVDGLGGLGVEIEDHRDGFLVHGSGGLRGGWLDARGDHRLAMLGAVAGLASREGVTVHGIETVTISYPAFEADLASVCG
ncbi:MAG: 3-phosphoshikimate 1-carboxyvinyltransferase [Solirubrobacterales bacterium]|nr:3-phosphoshikimate 1-carboxyvinyltransferase [Solirubrobacterales bacterium]